ncbi:MAG: hypothetical protein HUU32_17590 [Calditrichaceae bacterium]|nr:NHL repeat-containing protein [Calditrichia bacterium]NUQ43206.1 hypothetical protein [Calditrichaceae bacterium]
MSKLLFFCLLLIGWLIIPGGAAFSQTAARPGDWPAGWQALPLHSFPAEIAPPEARFTKASAIDIDPEGRIYIVDRDRHRLLKFAPDGSLLRQIGGFGRGNEQFDDPRDVNARTTLNVFVADYNNNRVVRYDRSLNFLGALNAGWPEPYDFERVRSIAMSSQYDLFLLEDGTKKIVKFTRFAEPVAAFGGIYETYGQLLDPQQITLDDNSKRLFVSDPAQQTVLVFDYLGNFITAISHPALQQPGGLFWGEDRQLYVADLQSGAVLVFSENLKFSGRISLPESAAPLVGVAVKHDRESGTTLLYTLEPALCRVFSLEKIKP